MLWLIFVAMVAGLVKSLRLHNIPRIGTLLRARARLSAVDNNEVDIDKVMEHIETRLLFEKFGHEKFREGQREIIRSVLAGKSCLAVLPTGAGKSLLYRLPSQVLDGITVVVSPLLALMRDQVEALRSQNIAAVRIDSSMTMEEVQSSVRSVKSGLVKVLYVSPERFNNEAFKRLLSNVKVALFVVDEAHCISEWGHAFRPDYLRLSHFATVSDAKIRLALTATATSRVAQDILEKLDISQDDVVRLPSLRRNIQLAVKPLVWGEDGYEDRLAALLTFLPRCGSHIVYVSRQKLAERLAADLRAEGFSAKAYHAGMTGEAREEVEGWFLRRVGDTKGGDPIVVGTVAFGMGIDKKDIRGVVHFDMPRSVEDYVQGFGRSGRDGQAAHCTAMLAESDGPALRSQIYGATPSRLALAAVVDIVFAARIPPGSEEKEREAPLSGRLSTVDPAVFINYYDLSLALDVNELQLRLTLSHLVQLGVVSEVTPVYGSRKVGMVDKQQLADLLRVLSEGPGAGLGAGAGTDCGVAVDAAPTDEEEEGAWAGGGVLPPTDGESGVLRLSSSVALKWCKLCERIAAALVAREESAARKKKWHALDTLALSNELGVLPSEFVFALTLLCKGGVCEDGGLTRIYNRFHILDAKAGAGAKAQTALTQKLHAHVLEIQRRSLSRADEIVALLQRGAAGASVWAQIAQYFDEGGLEEGNEDKEEGNEEKEKEQQQQRLLPFNKEGWAQVERLVLEGAVPCDDPTLVARFAAGVSSPRIGKLKLSKAEAFGAASSCDWIELIDRAAKICPAVQKGQG
jgi:ATP-dependent DNA helicase RecQ